MPYNEWQHSCWWKSCRRATLFTGRRMQTSWGGRSVTFWTKTPQATRTDPCWQGEDRLWTLTASVHISSRCLISVSTPLSLLVFVSINMLFCWSFKATSLSILVTWGSHHERLRATSLNHQKGSCIAKWKNKLCYVTHWCCCCFWWWLRAGERRRGWGGTRTRWQAGTLRRLYCPRTAPTPFLYLVYSSLSLTPRPTAQQHDITDWRRNKTPLLLPSISHLTDESTCLHPRSHYCCWVWAVLMSHLLSASAYCLQSLVKKALFKWSLNGLLLTCSLWLCLLYFQFMLTHSSHCVFVCSYGIKTVTWHDEHQKAKLAMCLLTPVKLKPNTLYTTLHKQGSPFRASLISIFHPWVLTSYDQYLSALASLSWKRLQEV